MFSLAYLFLVFTVTVPCEDDVLRWDPVPDADIASYRIYEVVDELEVVAWEVPGDVTEALMGCPAVETAYCIRAVDTSDNRSFNCSNHVTVETIDCGTFNADGSCAEWRQIGRFMWIKPCDLLCSKCIEWSDDHCLERAHIGGTTCCVAYWHN